MQTTITKENLTREVIAQGFKNKFGMEFQDTPTVKKAIADCLHNHLMKLHGKK